MKLTGTEPSLSGKTFETVAVPVPACGRTVPTLRSGCRERTKRLELELAAAQQELAEVAVQEDALKSEEDEFWRRYDALWLDLHVRCSRHCCFITFCRSKRVRGTDMQLLRHQSQWHTCRVTLKRWMLWQRAWMLQPGSWTTSDRLVF